MHTIDGSTSSADCQNSHQTNHFIIDNSLFKRHHTLLPALPCVNVSSFHPLRLPPPLGHLSRGVRVAMAVLPPRSLCTCIPSVERSWAALPSSFPFPHFLPFTHTNLLVLFSSASCFHPILFLLYFIALLFPAPRLRSTFTTFLTLFSSTCL